ncbi:MAG: hypothetical protein NVS1B10_01800 [Candidatus Saccharimonadales bacterium]
MMENYRPEPIGDDNLRIVKIQRAIEEAVIGREFDWMVDVARHQKLQTPFEMIQFMDDKRKNSENDESKSLWREGLFSYIPTVLDGLESDEATAVAKLFIELEFDEIILNPSIAVEPARYDKPQVFTSWEDATIHIDLEPEIFNEIRDSALFKEIVSKVRASLSEETIAEAIEIINTKAEAGYKLGMHKIMDWFVSQLADTYAHGIIEGQDIAEGKQLIDRYASDLRSAKMMHASMDRYIFARAESHISPDAEDGYSPESAKKIIEQYASTPEICQAMLNRLGL